MPPVISNSKLKLFLKNIEVIIISKNKFTLVKKMLKLS